MGNGKGMGDIKRINFDTRITRQPTYTYIYIYVYIKCDYRATFELIKITRQLIHWRRTESRTLKIDSPKSELLYVIAEVQKRVLIDPSQFQIYPIYLES